ncbi:MAG: DUF1566 domain-containing protein, partial [bacterium]|nr:DUF1566 domain-containing protein [bacterium]
MYQQTRFFAILERTLPTLSGVILLVSVSVPTSAAPEGGVKGVVDTAQAHCFDAAKAIDCPTGRRFSGQDAQYQGLAPAYRDHGDGTVTDLNTGLMWQQDPGAKQDYQAAVAGAASCRLAGYDDWRVPSIKELYSLIDFRGVNPISMDVSRVRPFIDSDVFRFSYGDPAAGDRVIDSQWVTRTIYESTVMGGAQCFFGVNFADGRIKCYPTRRGKG